MQAARLLRSMRGEMYGRPQSRALNNGTLDKALANPTTPRELRIRETFLGNKNEVIR